jgi:hypothetical protein
VRGRKTPDDTASSSAGAAIDLSTFHYGRDIVVHTLADPILKGREDLGPWILGRPLSTSPREMNDGELAGRAEAEKLEEDIVAVMTTGDGARRHAEEAVAPGALARQLLVESVVTGHIPGHIPRDAKLEAGWYASWLWRRGIGITHRPFSGNAQ